MKLYTKILLTLTGLIAASSLSSCDNIKEDNRFIPLPAIEAKRTVLLEEYTGQKCVNCPIAHLVIAELVDTYADNLVAVSIHGGGDAFSYNVNKYPFGLANDDSQAYSDEAKAGALPSGVVNRASGVTGYDQWGSFIRAEMAKSANMEIELAARLNADGTAIEIDTEMLPYDNIDGRLQLWVVESGIVSIQLTPNGRVSDYVHNHVFRAAVNGHDGNPVHLTTREPSSQANSIEINEHWNPENLSVVAFVYNSTGVLQAAKAKVESPKGL